MSKKVLVKIKATIFILVGLTLLGSYLVVIGNYQSVFSFSNEYKIRLNNVEGLFKGTPVTINGMKVGRVQKVELEGEKMIALLSIRSKYAYIINESSLVELKTEGFLGDRYVDISSTDFSKPPLTSGSTLKIRSGSSTDILSKDGSLIPAITQFFEESQKLLAQLNEAGDEESFGEALKDISSQLKKFLSEDKNKDVKDILKHTKSILRKIDRGKGTLGAIVNDRSLHNKAVSFLGGKPYKTMLQSIFSNSKDE